MRRRCVRDNMRPKTVLRAERSPNHLICHVPHRLIVRLRDGTARVRGRSLLVVPASWSRANVVKAGWNVEARGRRASSPWHDYVGHGPCNPAYAARYRQAKIAHASSHQPVAVGAITGGFASWAAAAAVKTEQSTCEGRTGAGRAGAGLWCRSCGHRLVARSDRPSACLQPHRGLSMPSVRDRARRSSSSTSCIPARSTRIWLAMATRLWLAMAVTLAISSFVNFPCSPDRSSCLPTRQQCITRPSRRIAADSVPSRELQALAAMLD